MPFGHGNGWISTQRKRRQPRRPGSVAESCSFLLSLLITESQQAQVFTFSHNYIQTLFGLRKDTVIVLTREGKITQAHRSLRTLTKLVRTCGKYFRRLQQLDASRFVELPQCGDLVLYYWKQVVDATGGPFELIAGRFRMTRADPGLIMCLLDTNEAVYPTQILVQGMVLFKDSLSQWVPKHRDGTDNPNSRNIMCISRNILTNHHSVNPGICAECCTAAYHTFHAFEFHGP